MELPLTEPRVEFVCLVVQLVWIVGECCVMFEIPSDRAGAWRQARQQAQDGPRRVRRCAGTRVLLVVRFPFHSLSGGFREVLVFFCSFRAVCCLFVLPQEKTRKQKWYGVPYFPLVRSFLVVCHLIP